MCVRWEVKGLALTYAHWILVSHLEEVHVYLINSALLFTRESTRDNFFFSVLAFVQNDAGTPSQSTGQHHVKKVREVY